MKHYCIDATILLQAPSALDSGVYYARIVYIHRSKRYKLYVTISICVRTSLEHILCYLIWLFIVYLSVKLGTIRGYMAVKTHTVEANPKYQSDQFVGALPNS